MNFDQNLLANSNITNNQPNQLEVSGFEEIELVNLKEDADAHFLFKYLTLSEEITSKDAKVYGGVDTAGRWAYIIFEPNAEKPNIYYYDEFTQVIANLKTDLVNAKLNQNKFAEQLAKRNIDISSLREIPMIPFNIGKLATALDLPRIVVAQSFCVFNASEFESDEFTHVITFNHFGNYEILKIVANPFETTPSRSLTEVYGTTENVKIGGEGLVKINPEDLKVEPTIQFLKERPEEA